VNCDVDVDEDDDDDVVVVPFNRKIAEGLSFESLR